MPFYLKNINLRSIATSVLQSFKDIYAKHPFTILVIVTCAGIILGFNVRILTSVYIIFALALGATILYLLPHDLSKQVSQFVGFFFFGVLAMSVKLASNKHIEPLALAVHEAEISGTIQSINYGKSNLIILNDIKVGGYNNIKLNKVKFFVKGKRHHGKIYNLQLNDKIQFKGNIYPLSVSPYINHIKDGHLLTGINASGSVRSEIIVLERRSYTLQSFTNMLRSKIAKRITRAAPDTNIGILVALLIGNTGYIKPDDLDNIRKSGFAHILAISGLHIGIVAGTFFIIVRFILSNFPFLALRYDIKKISALFTIGMAFFYLHLTSMSVSAVRSFLMFMLLLFGILIDRKVLPLRIWSLALFIIAITSPERIFTPSFQMSFMATFALIAIYKSVTQSYLGESQGSFYLKIASYIVMIFLSSLIASFVTIFYEIYHFSQCSLTGLISNELAIPLTEFILLPLGMLSIILMPLHMEKPIIWMGVVFSDILCRIAEFFSHLPYAYLLIPSQSGVILIVQTLAIIIAMLGDKAAKITGVMALLICGAIHYLSLPADQSFMPRPDHNKEFTAYKK